jgi:hypothetical protein
MPFKEITVGFSESRIKTYKYTIFGNIQIYRLLKEVVHVVKTEF